MTGIQNPKTDYVIVDDVKDIVIYNLTQKKVMRTISHKDGGSRINIYPAKEGHVMVAEYNKKEKYLTSKLFIAADALFSKLTSFFICFNDSRYV